MGEVRFDVQRLQTNFRSTGIIVEWINHCFSQLMPQTDDRERGAIAFRPSLAAPGRAQSPEGGVQLCGFVDRQEESDAIAAAIDAQLKLAASAVAGRHPGACQESCPRPSP